MKILPPFADEISRTLAPFRPLVLAGLGHLRELERLVRPLRDAMDATLAPLRTPEAIAALTELVRRFQEVAKWLDGAPEQLRAALEDAGVVPHPDLSLPDLVNVIRAFRERGRDAAVETLRILHSELFDDPRFRASLRARWLATRRGSALEQILQAHEAGFYAASVPAALAHAEGIIADAAGHTGHLKQDVLLGYVESMRAEDDLYGPVVAQFVGKFLFTRFLHGDPIPPFSRHAILHGADTAYGTKEKSLQALLWVDYLLLLVQARGKEAIAGSAVVE